MSAGPQFDASATSWLLKSLTDESAREGDLSHILHESQLEVLAKLDATKGRFVLETGRRWGKTFFLLALAFMTCLRKPGCRVVYGAPTLKHLTEFVLPAFNKICSLLPEDIRPRYTSHDSHITFPNKAWVHLFGCDDQRQADTGVGSDAEVAVFDECGAKGMASLLRYVIQSIFRPSLMTTGGRVILGSSPARMPEHEFTIMCELAEGTGNYANRTIYDNPRLTDAQREAFIAEDATDEGMTVEDYKKTDTFRREYLAERVIDKLLVVLPEWAEKRETLRRAVERPHYFDAHVIYDPGGIDPHFLLFGYWHFPMAKWVIEAELAFRDNENERTIVEAIKAKEKALYGTDRWDGTVRAFAEQDEKLWAALPDWMRASWAKAAPQNPRVRWMDSNIDKQRNLYDEHGMAFCVTAKNDKEAQVNTLRELVRSESVLMHPDCVHADRDWKATTWANHRRNDFARRAGSHGDGLDCGIYGARNLDRQRNPAPVFNHQHQTSAADRLAGVLHRRR